MKSQDKYSPGTIQFCEDKRTHILRIVQDIAAGRNSSVNVEQWTDAIMEVFERKFDV